MSSATYEAGGAVTAQAEGIGLRTSSSGTALVIRLQPVAGAKPKGSNGRFDSLLQRIEADPGGREELSAARKALSRKLYPNKGLAALRLDAGLSQAELAKRLDLQQSHVSRYESGRSEPSISKAAEMARALGVALDVYHQAWMATAKNEG